MISTYTCQSCGKEFSSKEEFPIFPNGSPVCSTKCVFNIYHKILSKYDKKDLVNIGNLLKMKNCNQLSDNWLLFGVTKKYPKASLSSINTFGHLDIDKKLWTKKDSCGQLDNNSPPMVIGGMSKVLSKDLVKYGKQELSKDEGITKWF